MTCRHFRPLLFPLLCFACLAVTPISANFSLTEMNCDAIPMSLWCSNSDLISKCGFSEICTRHQKATENQKIKITVLVESLCPDCQNFLTKILYPVVFKNFEDFVNIQLVPFGNAKIAENGTIICQHGKEECWANRFESCLIDSLRDQSPLPLMSCIEEGFQTGASFNVVFQECFEKLRISTDVQQSAEWCLVSKLGTQLQAQAAQITNNVWPEKHKFVPWIVVNGVSLTNLQGLQNQLPTLLCEWYNGDKPIPYCEASLKMRYKKASLKLFN